MYRDGAAGMDSILLNVRTVEQMGPEELKELKAYVYKGWDIGERYTGEVEGLAAGKEKI
jgi:hypothetical protein